MEQFPQFKKFTDDNDNFLKTKESKENVYEASYRLANYLKQEKINNIMFLDNSARQASIGLQEAWKEVGEEQGSPNIYFINPEEFINSVITRPSFKIDDDDFEELSDKFINTFKNINKGETLLLYDSCIHSGRSLFSIEYFLNKLGFSDVRLAVTSLSQDFPEEYLGAIDFVCLEAGAALGCRPFGRPSYVSDNPGEIVSKASCATLGALEKGRRERAKIRSLFKKNEEQ